MFKREIYFEKKIHIGAFVGADPFYDDAAGSGGFR